MMNSLPLTGNVGRTTPQPPEISVVIPTYNRADLLPALLEALLAQRVHAIPYEVLDHRQWVGGRDCRHRSGARKPPDPVPPRRTAWCVKRAQHGRAARGRNS